MSDATTTHTEVETHEKSQPETQVIAKATQKYVSFKEAAMASYQDYKDVYTRLAES